MATNPNNPQKELTIITSHINADFDAVASMLAAQKLYPGSLVVFPGSQEKNIRDFFIQSMAYMFSMADIKEIDFSKIKRLGSRAVSELLHPCWIARMWKSTFMTIIPT